MLVRWPEGNRISIIEQLATVCKLLFRPRSNSAAEKSNTDKSDIHPPRRQFFWFVAIQPKVSVDRKATNKQASPTDDWKDKTVMKDNCIWGTKQDG